MVRDFIVPFIKTFVIGLAVLGLVVTGLFVASHGHARVVVGSAAMTSDGLRDQTFLDTWSADTGYPVGTLYERGYTLAAGQDVCVRLGLGLSQSTVEGTERMIHNTLSVAQSHILVSDAHNTLCPLTNGQRV
jgi:hypothetical protein